MGIVEAFEYAFDNGYVGVMSWSMTEGNPTKFGSFTTTRPALERLWERDSAAIMVKNVNIQTPTGDMAMRLTMNNLPPEGSASNGGPWNELFIEQGTHNFSGRANFIFEMYIEPGSGDNLMIVPVVKMGSGWVWSPAQTESFTLAGMPRGEWITVSIPISAFVPESGTPDLTQIRGIVIQYFAQGTPYTGTIFFDNVRVDNQVLFNFNEVGSEWNTAAEGASVSLVSRPGASSVRGGIRTAAPTGLAPVVTVNGRILNVRSATDADMQIRMVNVRGRTVARFKAADGNGQFSIARIPAGRYIVETTVANRRVGSSAVIVK
jgi:hypothetical protein